MGERGRRVYGCLVIGGIERSEKTRRKGNIFQHKYKFQHRNMKQTKDIRKWPSFRHYRLLTRILAHGLGLVKVR